MARTKVHIEVSELQSAIDQLEGAKLFSSPHKLYVALAETPWAQQVGATWARIYFRIKEVNVDPDNPVITMRVKRARRAKHREPGDQRPVKTRRVKAVVFDGFDLLMNAFRDRGVEITGVEKLITSSQKSHDENRAIMLAWADLRDKLGIPKPVKKTLGVQTSASPTVTEITELPTAVEPITESEAPVIAVTEEMPDGSLVEPVVESEVPLAQLLAMELVEPSSAPVPGMAVPLPLQMTSVRPIPSRPTPVRSSLPPRPMPAV
jgi:hypothetical protein